MKRAGLFPMWKSRLVPQILAYILVALAAWFADGGMEALVLGCTHFPYFKEALAARTGLPLVDPAEEMLRLLTQ